MMNSFFLFFLLGLVLFLKFSFLKSTLYLKFIVALQLTNILYVLINIVYLILLCIKKITNKTFRYMCVCVCVMCKDLTIPNRKQNNLHLNKSSSKHLKKFAVCTCCNNL